MTERIHIAYAKVFKLLSRGTPASINELCKVSGLSYDTMLRFIATLRTRPKCVYICDWAEDTAGRRTVQVFALGTEDDKPRPKPRTGSERTRAYKERKQKAALKALQAILTPTLETV